MPAELKRHPRLVALVIAAVLAAAVALLFPGRSLASHGQEMILQDDSALIYSPENSVAAALRALKASGVDRVRVSVVWSLIAPQPSAAKEPFFDATKPDSYPAGVWQRYDFLDLAAQRIGVKVYFQPTAPAPNWATTPVPHNQGFRYANNINAKLYGQFVQAVGTRYSGRYVATNLEGNQAPLPRVNYWGVYNEPNIGGWLTPQWHRVHGHPQPAAPAIYRRMLDAAWTGLVNSGHRHDTILVGETGAYGSGGRGYGSSMDPLLFIRALYCVGTNFQPLTGSAATAVGCPARSNPSAFAAAHPGLFDAAGWAHHPYDFTHPPAFVRADPDSATLSGMPRLERTLDRVYRAYRQPGRIPIYVTEWGIQSRNPSPYVAFSRAQQAEYINEGEYMAWRDPRIRSFAQFLLVDSPPNTAYRKGSKPYWATFQSGLLTYPFDQPKPALHAFLFPLWVPSPRHGRRVSVWAQVRPLPRRGTFQFQRRGSSTWTNLGSFAPGGAEGVATTTLNLPAPGSLRLRWNGPKPDYSRIVPIS